MTGTRNTNADEITLTQYRDAFEVATWLGLHAGGVLTYAPGSRTKEEAELMSNIARISNAILRVQRAADEALKLPGTPAEAKSDIRIPVARLKEIFTRTEVSPGILREAIDLLQTSAVRKLIGDNATQRDRLMPILRGAEDLHYMLGG